jgi:hypothetical protein
VNLNTLNEIDSQYFSSLEGKLKILNRFLTFVKTLTYENFLIVPGVSSSKTMSSSDTDIDHMFKKGKSTEVHSNLGSEGEYDDLNFIDQQLLGEAQQKPVQNDYSSDDLLNPKNLEDLNYFDKVSDTIQKPFYVVKPI